ncbi:hypothetical protein TNCV_2801501 [Trichonephila clavipes]|nr:hypothetical protein TNCV_2801501 [Trichonephila clavipes]
MRKHKNISKYPGHHLDITCYDGKLRKPGPRRSRRGLRKQDSSCGPCGRSLGSRGQNSVLANLPDHSIQSIAHPGYAVSNALRTSALKRTDDPSCWNHIKVIMFAETLCSRTGSTSSCNIKYIPPSRCLGRRFGPIKWS